jgi:hypothetical protein
MNCRKGDLAVVVRFVGATCRTCGKRWTFLTPGSMVDCEELSGPTDWAVPVRSYRLECEHNSAIVVLKGVSDAALQPLRHHGDDERDESLDWLPTVPMTTEAMA